MAIIDKIQLSGTVYTIGNETTTAVTSASTDNEIPTAKAVYDAIPKGGGGGKAVSAGTNISITTGETADTINCTLPISGGTGVGSIIGCFSDNTASGNYSFVGGTSYSEANGEASFAFGYSVIADKDASTAFGKYTITKNLYEFGCGILNKSVKGIIGSKDSGSTIFSVGNGKNDTRHNAFEIRQNGDIYIADTNDTSTTNYYEKPMIKLQDALGGGGGSITIDPSLDSGSTNPVANSAITNAINSKENHLTNYLETWTILKEYSKGCNALYFTYRKNDNEVTGWFPFANINGKSVESENNFSLVETSAITTSITSSSTDAQVPSAKAVYDMVGNINTILESI